jgi:hypothetical protein
LPRQKYDRTDVRGVTPALSDIGPGTGASVLAAALDLRDTLSRAVRTTRHSFGQITSTSMNAAPVAFLYPRDLR